MSKSYLIHDKMMFPENCATAGPQAAQGLEFLEDIFQTTEQFDDLS